MCVLVCSWAGYRCFHMNNFLGPLGQREEIDLVFWRDPALVRGSYYICTQISEPLAVIDASYSLVSLHWSTEKKSHVSCTESPKRITYPNGEIDGSWMTDKRSVFLLVCKGDSRSRVKL